MKSMTARILSITIITLVLSSCSLFEKTSTDKDVIVAEVNGEAITLQELKANFFRTSSPTDIEDEDEMKLEEFLDLYIDYKLKLAAAKDGEYFENETILTELQNYESQSAVPFWLEKRVRDELLEEFYQRAREEIHASHILIQVSENASPRDTLRIYNRLMEARAKYLSGEAEDFEQLSQEYSSRQGGRSMGGNLGYFSAGFAVKAFEDAAYATPVDSVSLPFRSQFGYHVVKVYDRRESKPEHLFSHIFFNTRGGDSSPQEAMEKAREAYELVADGADWNEVTQRYTDDMQSRRTGGNIGWTNRSRFAEAPIFSQAIFSLEQLGEYTEPFESEYGIHIVRLDSVRSFESKKAEMDHHYERLRTLPRYRENQKAVLSAIKRTGNARVHLDTQKAFEDFLEGKPYSDFDRQPWEERSDLLNKTMYSINNVNYTVQDFRDWLIEKLETESAIRYRYQHLKEFADEMTKKHIIEITKQEFDEFAQLSRDYLNGLIVFSITEDSVWNYAGSAEDALRRIYEENPEDYWFEQRYRYVRIAATADSTLLQIKAKMQDGVIADSIRNHFQGVIVRRDMINSIQHFPFSEMQGLEEGDFSDIFEYRRRQTLYYLEEIMEPRQMDFEEAYNKLVATYQPMREKQWIKNMRTKYSVHSWPERISQNK